MKLLNSFGPNPRIVRMFLAEKGIVLPVQEIDLFGGENRREPYTAKNPSGQLPALELDDGSVIAETVAICEYLEELHPNPPLVGSTPVERAETRMWVRRVELNATEFLYYGFRYAEALELFKNRMRCIPEAASGLKEKGKDGLRMINGCLAGRKFLGGARLTLADIVLYCCVDFTIGAGMPLDADLHDLAAWVARVRARPSATASLSPGWEAIGTRG